MGKHLRTVRMDRGMLQREVAAVIGVSPGTVYNWERGRSWPALRNWPAVIGVLGFVPFEVGDTLGGRIRAWRKIHGVPRSELAHRLGVDASTVTPCSVLWTCVNSTPCGAPNP